LPHRQAFDDYGITRNSGLACEVFRRVTSTEIAQLVDVLMRNHIHHHVCFFSKLTFDGSIPTFWQ
jgi:hypothetical protein